MKFIYNEEMTKTVVQNYFKKNEDIEGELVISCGSRKIPMCGRAFVEYDAPYVSFRLKGSMDFDEKKFNCVAIEAVSKRKVKGR